MRKKKYSFLAIVLIAVLVMAGSSTAFGAQTFTTVKTKANQWNTIKFKPRKIDWDNFVLDGGGLPSNLYKIKISDPGYLTLSFKAKYKKDTEHPLYMYHLPGSFKKGTYKQIINSSYDNGTYAQIDSNETVKIPVDKGIYYVQFGHTVRYKGEENKARKTGQFRYKFTRVKPTENFSPAKAETLSANKKVTVCVTQEYAYSRWYKISLPEKRKITIWGPQFDENDVTVYDSDLNYVETKQSGKNKRVTKLTQEKGTYYIRVFNDDNIEYDDIPVPSGLYTLKWK